MGNIALAQCKLELGEVSSNLEIHTNLIKLANQSNCKAIFFPELSVSGYMTEQATEFLFAKNDARLKSIQLLAIKYSMIIGVGCPTETGEKPQISMFIFLPNGEILTYSKQYLHFDELPYYNPGNKQIIVDLESARIALAICYEATVTQHFNMKFAK